MIQVESMLEVEIIAVQDEFSALKYWVALIVVMHQLATLLK